MEGERGARGMEGEGGAGNIRASARHVYWLFRVRSSILLILESPTAAYRKAERGGPLAFVSCTQDFTRCRSETVRWDTWTRVSH